MPGHGPEGKGNCTGNLSRSIEVGPLTLTYNSQFREYPNARPDYGWGKSISVLSRIFQNGTGLVLVEEDGTEREYKSAGGKWISGERLRGDQSRITQTGGGYQLEEGISGARTVYAQAYQGSWFPTESIDEVGGRTTYSNYQGAIPTLITDTNTTRQIRLTPGADGRVATISDYNGLNYSLKYTPTGLLSRIELPGTQAGLDLLYTSEQEGNLKSLKDPFGRATQYGYFKHGRVATVSTSRSLRSFNYTANWIYESNGLSTKTFKVYYYSPTGYITQVRQGDGDYFKLMGRITPGRLVYAASRDAIGRLTEVKDQFERTTQYFYNEQPSCSLTPSSPGTSLFPTCVKFGDLITLTTRDALGRPTLVKAGTGSGPFASTVYTWDGLKLKAKTVQDSLGRTTAEEITEYQGALPAKTTRRSTTYFDQYDSVDPSRPLNVTGPSGQTNVFSYQDGENLSLTTGGLPSFSVNTTPQANGSRTVVTTSYGLASTMTQNFLGTQVDYKVGAIQPWAQSGAMVTGKVSSRIGQASRQSDTTVTAMGPGGREVSSKGLNVSADQTNRRLRTTEYSN
jgi:YD repeat-containing protein